MADEMDDYCLMQPKIFIKKKSQKYAIVTYDYRFVGYFAFCYSFVHPVNKREQQKQITALSVCLFIFLCAAYLLKK